MTVNTAYLGTPSAATTVLSDLSVSGALYSNTVASTGAITGTTITGSSTVAGSGLSIIGLVLNVKSLATTASATSATLGNNTLGLYESTNSAMVLVYRSGNTTYAWASSSGSVG